MTNWLESEEKKKAIEDERIALQVREARNRDQILSEKENLIHNELNAFFDLCNRVSKIKKTNFHIDKLSITGWKDLRELSGYRSLSESRSISFSATATDQILIKIQQYTIINNHLLPPDKPKYIVHLEKNCSHKVLINWQEEEMINIIRWIIYESSFSQENLPGGIVGLVNKKKWFF